MLEEVTAHASSVVTAPTCLIAFIDDGQSADAEEHGTERDEAEHDMELTGDLSALQVPVYTDSFKSHLVCSLPVPYVKDQRDMWHQRGVSFHLRAN